MNQKSSVIQILKSVQWVLTSDKKCQEGSAFEGAFKSFKYLRDSWEHPERFVKIAPEYIEYMAATEIDFEEYV